MGVKKSAVVLYGWPLKDLISPAYNKRKNYVHCTIEFVTLHSFLQRKQNESMCSDFICLKLTIFWKLTNYYIMYLCISNPGTYLGLESISNLPNYNTLLWNDVVDQSRKRKLMDALRKNIEENLCGKDINHTHFRKKSCAATAKK